MATRFGVMGTGRIAGKFLSTIKHVDSAVVVALASRSLEKATEFLAANDTADAAPVGSYDDLLAREDVDAVYIPLPTGLRKGWVIKAARAGKHVLAEKPAAVSAEDLAEMLAACKENGVQYMDGVMFMHNARLPAMSTLIHAEAKLGELRRVTSGFSFCAPDDFLASDIRLSPELEPFGCLGDLGWYNIRLSLFAFQYDMPKEVLTTHSKLMNGVPVEFDATLYWEDGRTAGFTTSFRAAFRQWGEITGTTGTLTLDDFCLTRSPEEACFRYETDAGLTHHGTFSSKHEVAIKTPAMQEAALVAAFGALVAGGAPDSFWPEVTMKTQVILDACFLSARTGNRQAVPALPPP